MADPASKKPEAYPPAVQPVDDDDDEPQSTLAPDVAEREAQKAIREIEEEIEQERPSKPAKPPHEVHAGPQASFMDKAWERQNKVEANLKKLGHGRYSRVIKMARKPEPEEYNKAVQITAIGILVIGMIGFLIYLLMQWVMGLLGVT